MFISSANQLYRSTIPNSSLSNIKEKELTMWNLCQRIVADKSGVVFQIKVSFAEVVKAID